MELSPQALNRTLLDRQHLLSRTSSSVPAMVEHLVGLQAQDNLPPYLGLAARLEGFDPYDVTRGLEDRSLVRLLTMRSTVHLLVADDALVLRRFTRPIHERERKVSQMVRAAIDVDLGEFSVAVRAALADGPLPVKRLGEALTATFPDVPANALAHLARVAEPLAQLPPRGCWKQPGGVVYQYVDAWVGRPMVEPDPAAIVRRYLAAYGPASAADVTSWSGVPGMPAVLAAMDDLVRAHRRVGQEAVRRADGGAGPRGHARAGASARPLRQRLALARRPRPRHRTPTSASAGWASTAASPRPSSSTAGSKGCGGSRTASRWSSSCSGR